MSDRHVAGPARIALVGATGMVGRRVIEVASAGDEARIVGIARRETPLPPGARMEMFVADPTKWAEVLEAVRPRALICTLGTTWKKAGRDAESNRKRLIEMTELRRYLDDLGTRENEDRDVVVLGDFNSGTNFPEAEAFTAQRLATYLTKPGAGTTIIHFNQQIDQIVPLTAFAEVKSGTFEIHNREGLRDRDAWRKRYSDHFPITVDLAATPDDDPQARFSPAGR